jgi:transposase-like protein
MKPELSMLNGLSSIQHPTLEAIIRAGAQQMIAMAVEAEVKAYMEQFAHITTPEGKAAMVRNGYLPERSIATSAGPISVRVPRTRASIETLKPFISALIPRYMRKSLNIEEAVPLLYLGGLSNNDFIPAFEKLFGELPAGFSSASITRMKQLWLEEHKAWNKRDLSLSRYCYLWADGIHFNLRLDEGRLCVLVLLGATPDGQKELVAVSGGYRESAESWLEILRGLKERGMSSPNLCIGDGALGFWKAIRQVYPAAEHQRCWVHKTANVLDKMPKSVQPSAKSLIHEIYRAETETDARSAYQRFQERYQAKYPKAVENLMKDEASLFTFYHFPAEHWQHIRSTNVIESAVSTVRLRTAKTRGQGTMATTLAMVFKLAERAQLRWRRLRGHNQIPKVINGVKFIDGIEDTLAA